LLKQDFNLKITLPVLEEGSQSLKIRLLPGGVDYYNLLLDGLISVRVFIILFNENFILGYITW